MTSRIVRWRSVSPVATRGDGSAVADVVFCVSVRSVMSANVAGITLDIKHVFERVAIGRPDVSVGLFTVRHARSNVRTFEHAIE